ncbi:MAG: ABC transporter substrate-binding protein [Chloroflexi bacterium]|nr:ABC transporter substrate-binding protein [Chloroflexota bacterium]
MILSRRTFLRVGAAAVGSAAALSTACAPVAPTAPPTALVVSSPTTLAPTSQAPTSVPSPTSVPAPTPTAVAALKIGVLVPYTESSIGVDIGLNQKRAADLYLKRQDGKLAGRAVSVVYSAESVETAINKVKLKTLVDTEKVEVLMGAAAADAAYAMRAAAEAAKIVYIDTNATANALTRSTTDCQPSCKSKYVFRTSATSWQLSQPLGQWVARSGVKEVLMCCVDDTFGTESADAFEAGLALNGGQSTDRHVVPSGGDWRQVIASIKAQPTHNVYAAFHTDDAEGFITEWNKQALGDAGYKLYGPGPLTEQEVLNQTRTAAEGIVSSHFWSTELSNAENKMLVHLFPQEYTDDETGAPVILTAYAVQMWDAMTALDEALKNTSGATRDTDALIAALERVSFKSPRGMFAFDQATHNPIEDIYIREVTPVNANLVNTVRDRYPGVAAPGA